MKVQKYSFLMKYKSMINTSNSRVNWAAGIYVLTSKQSLLFLLILYAQIQQKNS
jgi:hypothetical protein